MPLIMPLIMPTRRQIAVNDAIVRMESRIIKKHNDKKNTRRSCFLGAEAAAAAAAAAKAVADATARAEAEADATARAEAEAEIAAFEAAVIRMLIQP